MLDFLIPMLIFIYVNEILDDNFCKLFRIIHILMNETSITSMKGSESVGSGFHEVGESRRESAGRWLESACDDAVTSGSMSSVEFVKM